MFLTFPGGFARFQQGRQRKRHSLGFSYLEQYCNTYIVLQTCLVALKGGSDFLPRTPQNGIDFGLRLKTRRQSCSVIVQFPRKAAQPCSLATSHGYTKPSCNRWVRSTTRNTTAPPFSPQTAACNCRNLAWWLKYPVAGRSCQRCTQWRVLFPSDLGTLKRCGALRDCNFNHFTAFSARHVPVDLSRLEAGFFVDRDDA